MWTRIQNVAVIEITDIDPTNRYHPSIPMEACPSETGVGWNYEGEIFSPLPPEPIEELAYEKRREINATHDEAFAAGMPFTFHDGSEDVIQTRPEDKSNLLGIAIEARDLHEAGVADTVIEFRAASNTTYAITPTKAVEMTNAALAHVKAIYDRSWQRKDAIRAALEAEDREGIEGIMW